MTKRIAIIYYSMYGHIRKMAEAVKMGVDSVDGCEGVLLQVAETLPPGVLEKMGAPPKSSDPVIDPHDLPNYDGFLFGIPTRFGMMPAQMKAVFDATGGLWQKGSLIGKPAGMFVSTSTQGGGQETTALTTISQLAHHGCIFVSLGYPPAIVQKISSNEAARGGSAYGAGTLAGADGSRQPSEVELETAEYQGHYFAGITKKLAA